MSGYRDETENLRQRVAELERELAKSHRTIEALTAERQRAETQDEDRADTSVPGLWIAAIALVGASLGIGAAVVYSSAWFLLAGLVTGAGVGWASGRLWMMGSGPTGRDPRPAVRIRLADDREDEDDRAEDELKPSARKRLKRARR